LEVLVKRFAALIAILGVIALISGCSVLRGVINKARSIVVNATPTIAADTLRPDEPADETTPDPSPEPSALPTAKPTGAQPTKAANEYMSAMLGIMFTLPDSWTGKYHVDEGDGYLTVYFVPEEPIDETKGDGMLFTVIVKEAEDDGGFFDNEREIGINGVKYLCGTSTDVSYLEDQPEYETYEAMMRDLPAVFDSIRAAEGE
jgi:hypothetical protein